VEFARPTSGPAAARRVPTRAPANDAGGEHSWLNAPREDDPSRPLASYDVRLARRDPSSGGQPSATSWVARGIAGLRAISAHVETAFIVVAFVGEFALVSYLGAYAVRSVMMPEAPSASAAVVAAAPQGPLQR
jgi:hypothetical protein